MTPAKAGPGGAAGESGYLKLGVPFIILVLGVAVSMLGLKRFEQIDRETSLLRGELSSQLQFERTQAAKKERRP